MGGVGGGMAHDHGRSGGVSERLPASREGTGAAGRSSKSQASVSEQNCGLENASLAMVKSKVM